MAVVFTREAGERIAEAVRLVERNYSVGAPPRDGQPFAETIFARITSSTPDGSGHYAAVLTRFSAADLAWTEYGTGKVRPLAGETFTSGQRVGVLPAGATAGDERLYLPLAGAGGSAITVEEADGSPSYPGVAVLRVDQADGFFLTQPAAGVVRLDQTPASPSSVGYVTTAAQTFVGAKHFDTQISWQQATAGASPNWLHPIDAGVFQVSGYAGWGVNGPRLGPAIGEVFQDTNGSRFFVIGLDGVDRGGFGTLLLTSGTPLGGGADLTRFELLRTPSVNGVNLTSSNGFNTAYCCEGEVGVNAFFGGFRARGGILVAGAQLFSGVIP